MRPGFSMGVTHHDFATVSQTYLRLVESRFFSYSMNKSHTDDDNDYA